MKKLFMLCLIALAASLQAQDLQNVTNELGRAITDKNSFVVKKNHRIAAYRKKLAGISGPEREYAINQQLYEEYRKFKIDSALYFVRQNIDLSANLKESHYLDRSKIQLANLYSSNGNFLESETLLKGIRAKKLGNDLKALYYEFYSQFYEHYTTNNPGRQYEAMIETYRDSLLGVLNPSGEKYRINLAQHYMYHGKDAGAKVILKGVEQNSKGRTPAYAMAVYLQGDIAAKEGREQESVRYYSLAAITDIENSIKDNAALQQLAIYYYNKGKIDLAYKYAQSALEDAVFCNVKFRTLMMSEFNSIINAAYREKENNAKVKLETYLLLISLLSFFLIVAVVYVYRQMRKVSKTREELLLSGQQLEYLNSELQQANVQLHESNRVKEEYIAQFFDICSSYIGKLDDYRKKLNKKAMTKQYEELSAILRSDSFIDEELHSLYARFDMLFINLYPNFVSDFNKLLLPEEQIEVREGEILNNELRIFALERLGITDGVKIAAFLRYSISTIYNYRTRVRNKAAVSREEFERKLKTIG
ncbi:DUF6377 domain-containing protein [Flavobacterium sp.]|uniref:DUF6377 domain-containing protein n=1 Tax=Flavobacterium sp. TaxID=239 RepID=UPI0040349282